MTWFAKPPLPFSSSLGLVELLITLGPPSLFRRFLQWCPSPLDSALEKMVLQRTHRENMAQNLSSPTPGPSKARKHSLFDAPFPSISCAVPAIPMRIHCHLRVCIHRLYLKVLTLLFPCITRSIPTINCDANLLNSLQTRSFAQCEGLICEWFVMSDGVRVVVDWNSNPPRRLYRLSLSPIKG
jgi:hypothetical protein